jgi:hypothetical protein
MIFQIRVLLIYDLFPWRISPLERFMDCGKQFVFVNRFDEDIPSTGLHRANGSLCGIGVDQDDDVGAWGFPPDGLQKLQTLQIRHGDIQNGNIDMPGTYGLDRGATEPGCLYTPRLGRLPDDVPQPPANISVAVRDEETDISARAPRGKISVCCD